MKGKHLEMHVFLQFSGISNDQSARGGNRRFETGIGNRGNFKPRYNGSSNSKPRMRVGPRMSSRSFLQRMSSIIARGHCLTKSIISSSKQGILWFTTEAHGGK